MIFRKATTLFTVGIMAAGMLAGTGLLGAAAAEKTEITEAKAKEIALADAGFKETEVIFDRVEVGTEQGASVYEIEFKTTVTEYDYDIAVADGEIVKESWETRRPSARGTQISQEEAKAIALKDAGVAEKDATFKEVKNGNDDGVALYEIEFENTVAEFDYDIAKAGGKILGVSKKIKAPASAPVQQSAAAGAQTAQTGKTGNEAAIAAALGHAGFTADQVTGLKCEKDNDDGREIYEVEFKKDGYEYNYDIDAASYSVLEWEKERDD